MLIFRKNDCCQTWNSLTTMTGWNSFDHKAFKSHRIWKHTWKLWYLRGHRRYMKIVILNLASFTQLLRKYPLFMKDPLFFERIFLNGPIPWLNNIKKTPQTINIKRVWILVLYSSNEHQIKPVFNASAIRNKSRECVIQTTKKMSVSFKQPSKQACQNQVWKFKAQHLQQTS